MPIVEAIIPMLAKVGIKVKVKQVETAVLIEIARKGEFEAYIHSAQTGPDPLAAHEMLPFPDSPITACNYIASRMRTFDKLIDEAGQTERRGQAQRAAAKGQWHAL